MHYEGQILNFVQDNYKILYFIEDEIEKDYAQYYLGANYLSKDF